MDKDHIRGESVERETAVIASGDHIFQQSRQLPKKLYFYPKLKEIWDVPVVAPEAERRRGVKIMEPVVLEDVIN